MKYSNWAAFEYGGSSLSYFSEILAGLEQQIRNQGENPAFGNIGPGWGPLPCIPPFGCRVIMPRVEDELDNLETSIKAMFAAARDLIQQAKGLPVPITEFEVEVSGLPGPAPDRREHDPVS